MKILGRRRKTIGKRRCVQTGRCPTALAAAGGSLVCKDCRGPRRRRYSAGPGTVCVVRRFIATRIGRGPRRAGDAPGIGKTRIPRGTEVGRRHGVYRFAGGRGSDYGGRGTCPAAEPKQLRVPELNRAYRAMLLFTPSSSIHPDAMRMEGVFPVRKRHKTNGTAAHYPRVKAVDSQFLFVFFFKF